MKTPDTKTKILKEGRALLQKHGYNGFSFQDIADIIHIKKPSMYDHYSSKDELIIAIIADYSAKFDDWIIKINDLTPLEKVMQVFHVFYAFASDEKKVCPILALTTDLQVLSKATQTAMKLFNEKWLSWLATTIKQGQKDKTIKKNFDAQEVSQLIYSQIMGAQLQARIKNDPKITLESGKLLVSLIAV